MPWLLSRAVYESLDRRDSPMKRTIVVSFDGDSSPHAYSDIACSIYFALRAAVPGRGFDLKHDGLARLEGIERGADPSGRPHPAERASSGHTPVSRAVRPPGRPAT